MGILEKTRAILVSKLGPRIKDAGADARALRDLILELERARSDITRGLARLAEEEKYAAAQEADAEALEKMRGDIREGEEELARVAEGIEAAKAALASVKQ